MSAGASAQDRRHQVEIADALCEAGRFGQKTGKGYYIYTKGSRTPIPDPEVEKLIDALRKKASRAVQIEAGNPRAH
jgi:3-hydroxyacyl-CoA dehydrogenase